MGSFILRTVRPDALQNWIRVNAVGSLQGVPKDSWKKYLAANSGTGKTYADLEMSFLIAAGATGKSQRDLWDDYLGRVIGQAGTRPAEKARARYK
jgi:hypothetical protein